MGYKKPLKFAYLRNMCHSIDFEAYVYLNARKLFLRNKQLAEYRYDSRGKL